MVYFYVKYENTEILGKVTLNNKDKINRCPSLLAPNFFFTAIPGFRLHNFTFLRFRFCEVVKPKAKSAFSFIVWYHLFFCA